MKKHTLIITTICLFIWQASFSQKTEKEREIGIYTTELLSSNFGAQYKASLKNDWYWTLGAFNATAYSRNNYPGISSTFASSNNYYHLNTSLGLEKHKYLTENLSFFTGPSLSLSTFLTSNRTKNPSLPIEKQRETTFNYGVGVGWSIGLKVKICKNFQLGTFITPQINAEHTQSSQHSSSDPNLEIKNSKWNFHGNLSTNIIKLALYYHW